MYPLAIKNGHEKSAFETDSLVNGHFRILDWLEVPTIYKAYCLGLCKGIPPQNMAKHVVQYLHFRILEISHWSWGPHIVWMGVSPWYIAMFDLRRKFLAMPTGTCGNVTPMDTNETRQPWSCSSRKTSHLGVNGVEWCWVYPSLSYSPRSPKSKTHPYNMVDGYNMVMIPSVKKKPLPTWTCNHRFL